MKRTFKLVGLLSLIMAGVLAFTTPSDRYFEIQKNLDIFATLFKELNYYYVDEVDPSELVETGIEAMLESLDPYTNYIPEENVEDYRIMTTNEYGGIGSLIRNINGRIVIAMPHLGFPAERAGLKIGDHIVEVNGIDVRGRSTSEISKLLKGKAKTPVSLKVARYGESEPIQFDLIREKIVIDNIGYYGMAAETVGYIKLSDFTTGAGKEVKNAVLSLKSEGARSLILDLRGNPGGLLNEAVNVANVFVDKGKEIVSTRGKVKEWNKTYRALNSSVDTDIPLAVLIDGGSASASEIVAGVLQDYDRGVLIGNKTFGKGLVQATRILSYNSRLKVTTAKYYVPSGRCIQAIDYSVRNEDGSIGKIPDSLKVEFQTERGRQVFDGGGIDPDLEVKGEYIAPITLSLLSKGLLFDYSTHYYYTHEGIGDADDYDFSEGDYNNFVDWLSDKDYDYTTQVEEYIKKLVETSKEEKYYNQIKDNIKALESKVKHNKEEDLKIFQEEISTILEQQIAGRYYLGKGEYITAFDNDPDILAAVKILNDQSLYLETLARK